jgi:hypothetical protein
MNKFIDRTIIDLPKKLGANASKISISNENKY